MKKNLQVIKFRYFSGAFSILLLVIGCICYFAFGGFNKGIDFESGLSERVQIAPVGFSVTAPTADEYTLSVESNTLVLTRRNADGAKITSFDAASYPTVADVVKGLNAEGVSASAKNGNLATSTLVSGFGFPANLSTNPINVNFASTSTDVTIDQVRSALSSRDVNVQTVGSVSLGIFQLKASTKEGDTQEIMENDIASMLSSAFGSENVVVLQSDFVGPRFSSTLLTSSIKAILIAVILILAYIWIRFRFAFAISSVIALLHDILMMLVFITVFKLEVSSTTIAAVLTIIGYSLNNTIVIFDRVRENVKLYKNKNLDEIIDKSVSQSLTRTIITSLTTLFAVVPLAIFSTGAIQLFALNLIWGIIIGTYSSNFLAPALLHWFNKIKPVNVEKTNTHISRDPDLA